jgi:hypothetical protein
VSDLSATLYGGLTFCLCVLRVLRGKFFNNLHLGKAKKPASNLLSSVNFCSKRAHFCQFPAQFRSFLPSFFAQKCDSPIKSRFSVLPEAPNFKKALKNPSHSLFSDFFTLLLTSLAFLLLPCGFFFGRQLRNKTSKPAERCGGQDGTRPAV